MGFPQKRLLEKSAFFSGRGGEYVCPRCSSRVEVMYLFMCVFVLISLIPSSRSHLFLFPPISSFSLPQELPSQCNVCKLTLVSSPHLARSYHHLFPVPPFTVRFIQLFYYSNDAPPPTHFVLKCLFSNNISPAGGIRGRSRCQQQRTTGSEGCTVLRLSAKSRRGKLHG